MIKINLNNDKEKPKPKRFVKQIQEILVIGMIICSILGMGLLAFVVINRVRPADTRTPTQIKYSVQIPKGATNIILLGDRFYEFTYEGKKILIKDDSYGCSMVIVGDAK